MGKISQSSLAQLSLTRLREFYRQPEAVFWVYFFPLLMVVALGIAFRNKPVETITVDAVASPAAAVLAEDLAGDPRIVFQQYGEFECKERLRTGKSDLYLNRGSGRVDYFFDPTRPGSVVARDTVDNLLQRAAGRVDPVVSANQEMTETGGRYIDFLVPGLIGMGLMGGGLWGVGYAIVDMRIRKLLKRFLATPMRKTDFLMAVMASRLVFMIPEMILLVIFSHYAFGVEVHGSWVVIVFLVLLGALQFSGIGLLVASRAKTLESVSGLMNLTMLPMWTLSGIFFSYERFPEVMQPFIKLLPLTPLIDALRAVMLEGAGLGMLGPQILTMAVWGLLSFSLALYWFRWTD
ncbi:MAG: ABC transporter permease [Pirellulaceae bacterium]|nr:ABC transporter permease [Pirellulaceae bacterium]MDG2102109.1 ABC transporter permease [Pirellulaceae bacterium]